MTNNPFVQLIMKRPGINSVKISKIMELNINTVRKHLKETLERYPAFHSTNNGAHEAEIFLLERKKRFCEPYEYRYKRIISFRIDSIQGPRDPQGKE